MQTTLIDINLNIRCNAITSDKKLSFDEIESTLAINNERQHLKVFYIFQGKCNKELMIQIEWRQICYLCFTYQSQIVAEDA